MLGPGRARRHRARSAQALRALRRGSSPCPGRIRRTGPAEKVPELGRLLDACGIDALASAVLRARAVPLDATFFDKHARANWTVPGHQDRVIAVAATTSRKHRIRDGIAFAELDAKTLAGLVALRIHFDPTDRDTGALCVVPGSHLNGVMPVRFSTSARSGSVSGAARAAIVVTTLRSSSVSSCSCALWRSRRTSKPRSKPRART